MQEIFAIGEVVHECYEILRVIGSGGMGVVYEARDRELNRTVALKVSWPAKDPEQLVREAQVMAAFQHPGLPAVHAMGTHEGKRYVVMEHLRGRTLAEHLDATGSAVSVREARDLLLAVAESLTVLHSAKLAHCDLKPDNIMLTPSGRVVLVDFGVTDMETFVPGQPSDGVPHYAAPERITGEMYMGNAHLMDVYALGVIGFQMLTGRLPFMGDTDRAVLDAVVNQPAPVIAELCPDLDPRLAELIMEMMAKNPGHRPDSIEEVLVRLRDVNVHSLSATHTPLPLRVLIADDDPEFWDLVAFVLEDRGFRLVRVGTGDEARKQLGEQGFDVVFVNISMPGIHGLEFVHTVKKRHGDTEVVLISGSLSPEMQSQALLHGVSQFLTKPRQPEEVSAILNKLVTRQRAQRTMVSSAMDMSTRPMRPSALGKHLKPPPMPDEP